MAADNVQTQGYQCEFVDSVPDNFYCKKCNLVAKDLTVCNSCMESYCSTCITDTQKQGHPCPTCGEEHFQTLAHVKYQKRMRKLRVYCNLKKRGCCWFGTLEQLDTHLDPDKDNCQYMDTKCPLKCDQTVPKNKVEQHVSEECVKDYFCQNCSFKATYEEVVDIHLPECKKVILLGLNKCWNEYGRQGTENHMKPYPSESTELDVLGCEEIFKSMEEHDVQNNCKEFMFITKQVQQTLEEQEKKHKEKDTISIEMNNTEKRQQKQHKKWDHWKRFLLNLLPKHIDIEDTQKISIVISKEPAIYEFKIKNYSQEIKDEFSSPAMVTQLGHKFFAHVYISAHHFLCVALFSEPGESDDQLQWPARVKLDIQLLNKKGEGDIEVAHTLTWNKPDKKSRIHAGVSLRNASQLDSYLVTDTLHFRIHVLQYHLK